MAQKKTVIQKPSNFKDDNDSLVKFSIQFTEEQKKARAICHDKTVTVLTGKPGTAKTTIAASIALELLFRKEKQLSPDIRYHGDYRKIIVSRPTVEAGDRLGFMPGDMAEKLSPYTAPVLEVMARLILSEGDKKVKDLIANGKIEVMPIQFMRGHTFNDCIVILDEGQNSTLDDFLLISSRLGKNSKLIVTSDWRQIDLRDRNKSASEWFEKIYKLNGVGTFELTENFRHPLAIAIMDVLWDMSREKKMSEKLN